MKVELTSIKVSCCGLSSVNPWLAAHSISVKHELVADHDLNSRDLRKVAVSTADRNVQDQKEFLVKWRVGVCTCIPRICQQTAVFVLTFEFAKLP